MGTWWLLREIELAAARVHHLTFAKGADGLVEVSFRLPASKTDPGAVGITRSHGYGCDTRVWGVADPSLKSTIGEDPSLALCPVRTAARQVLHALDLRQLLGNNSSPLPLFPNVDEDIPPEEAVAATIDAAAVGLGIPILHADGQRKFGGHSLRVAGAQSRSRAGFDSWAIALLARWGSAVVLSCIRDVPLGTLTLLSRRAIPHLGFSLPLGRPPDEPPRDTALTSRVGPAQVRRA